MSPTLRLHPLLAAAICASLSFGLFKVPAQSQGQERIELVGQQGGSVIGVAAANDRAYIGQGTRLVAVDVSDPHAPGMLAQTDPLPAVVTDVEVSGNHAYAVYGTELLIADISDPQLLDVLSRYYLQALDTARRIVVDRGHAYVLLDSMSPEGVAIVDVSVPHNPERIDAPNWFLVNANDIAVADGYAYVTGPGLRVVDVSDPSEPAVVAELELSASSYGVALQGNHAFVTTGDGLRVVDVEDPMQPHEVAAVQIEGRRIAADGQVAAVGQWPTGIVTLDISDPLQPTVVSRTSTDEAVTDIVVTGGRIYVAEPSSGLHVLEGFGSSGIVGSYGTWSGARDLDLSGSHAFVAAGHSGLVTLDVAQPAEPTVRGIVSPAGDAVRVTAANAAAFVTTVDGPIAAVDVTEPTSPTVEAIIPALQDAHIHASEGLLFVSEQPSETLRVLDVADLSSPNPLDALDTPGWDVTTLSGDGSIVYAADRRYGLRIVDAGDPSSLQLLASLEYDAPQYSQGLALDGGNLYVMRSDRGWLWIEDDEPLPPPPPPGEEHLVRVDVSDPGAPRLVEDLGPVGWPRGLATTGGRIFAASGFAKYYQKALKVRQPGGRGEMEHVLPEVPRGVAASGDHVYVVGQNAGLHVYRVHGGPVPTPTPTNTPTPPDIAVYLPLAWKN